MKTLNWEQIPQSNGGFLERSETPTGWLVREIHEAHVDIHGSGRPESGYEWTGALTFVPDPSHLWLLK